MMSGVLGNCIVLLNSNSNALISYFYPFFCSENHVFRLLTSSKTVRTLSALFALVIGSFIFVQDNNNESFSEERFL